MSGVKVSVMVELVVAAAYRMSLICYVLNADSGR